MSVSKPSSARPRSEPEMDHGAQMPPSEEELIAIEDHRVAWSCLLGATDEEDALLGGRLITHSAPGSSLNFVAGIRWPDGAVDSGLERVVDVMSDRGVWPSIVVCEGLTTPSDVDSRLRANGWLPVFSDRIMFTRHAPVVPHLDPELRVEAVTPATALDSVRLETDAFGLLPEADRRVRRAARGQRGGRQDARVSAPPPRRGRGDGASGARADGRWAARCWSRSPPAPARLRPDAHRDRHPRRPRHWAPAGLAVRARGQHGGRQLYRSLGFAPAFAWTRWLAPA